MTIGELYRQIRNDFRSAGLQTPELDARLLVSSALKMPLSALLLQDTDEASSSGADKAITFASQRLGGMPVGRILGEREFYGRRFLLNEATLEPRPDTEILVDTVLKSCDPSVPLKLCDIGTGTGAIAVSLLGELPNAQMAAVDISERALACASRNAALNQVADRFLPVRADYADALAPGFDWVISNPPYIRSSVLGELDQEVRHHDPILALDGGEDGLEAYRRITATAARILVPGGRIAFEIGYDQGADLENHLRHHGFEGIEIIQDLGGRDRVATARRL